MDSVLNFLADYYFAFLGVSVVLLIALIGFIAGSRKKTPEVQTASETAQPNMTPTEPMGVQVDAFAPAAPAEPTTVSAPMQNAVVSPAMNEVAATPVQPMVNDINAGMPLPPEEPVRNDEPTLVIEDPSATPAQTQTVVQQPEIMQTPTVQQPQSLFEAPAAPTPAPANQNLFEVPNNTNQNM